MFVILLINAEHNNDINENLNLCCTVLDNVCTPLFWRPCCLPCLVPGARSENEWKIAMKNVQGEDNALTNLFKYSHILYCRIVMCISNE